MKKIILITLTLLSTVTHSFENPFYEFTGDYEVKEASCKNFITNETDYIDLEMIQIVPTSNKLFLIMKFITTETYIDLNDTSGVNIRLSRENNLARWSQDIESPGFKYYYLRTIYIKNLKFYFKWVYYLKDERENSPMQGTYHYLSCIAELI